MQTWLAERVSLGEMKWSMSLSSSGYNMVGFVVWDSVWDGDSVGVIVCGNDSVVDSIFVSSDKKCLK